MMNLELGNDISVLIVGLCVGSACAVAVAELRAWLARRRSRGPAIPPPVTDWKNPDFAPPAFPHAVYHSYEGAETLPCCVHCGGGRLHSVHFAGYVPAPGVDVVGQTTAEKLARYMQDSPDAETGNPVAWHTPRVTPAAELRNRGLI